jgi:hypothetical protein
VKVLALILVIMGAVGAVGATTAPAPVARADSPSISTTAQTTTTNDTFSRPPRMAAHIAPVAAPAKPLVKKAAPKPHKAAVKHVTHKVTRTHTTTRVVRSSSSGGSCGASCQWARGAAGWAGYPAWVESLGRCIAHHESWSPHTWTAENPSSSASGGFQFIDGTFAGWLGRAGISGSRHAANNSPVIQVRVFAYAVTHGGKHAWAGTNCPGT